MSCYKHLELGIYRDLVKRRSKLSSSDRLLPEVPIRCLKGQWIARRVLSTILR